MPTSGSLTTMAALEHEIRDLASFLCASCGRITVNSDQNVRIKSYLLDLYRTFDRISFRFLGFPNKRKLNYDRLNISPDDLSKL